MSNLINRDVTPLDGPSPPSKESREKAGDIGVPLTPKSERQRSTYGSLIVSMQAVRGLCPEGKCLRKDGHGDTHWPA